MAYPNVVVKIPQDYSSIISAILSGVFLLVGAWLAYTGTQKSNQVQKDIAKMQIDERLIAENKLRWSDESRILIAKFIRGCFEINHVIESTSTFKNSHHSHDINDLVEIQNEARAGLNKTNDLVQIVAEIRLHIFDYDDDLGNELLNKILEIESYFSKFEKIPEVELENLTELSRQYFNKQWRELTILEDD